MGCEARELPPWVPQVSDHMGNPQSNGVPCISMAPKGLMDRLRACQGWFPQDPAHDSRIRLLSPHHRLRAVCGRQQGSWMFVPGSSLRGQLCEQQPTLFLIPQFDPGLGIVGGG